MEININKEYVLNTAKEILKCNSPSGFCFEVMEKVRNISEGFGYKCEFSVKGGVIITIEGESNEKTVALSAHVDTLGAMVRSITDKGTLKITPVGGPTIPTLDGEYCIVKTRDGKEYTGTILCNSPSSHVYEDAASKQRVVENMEVRIDEVVKSKQDVLDLGICNGDYIFIDPKTTITESGFIK